MFISLEHVFMALVDIPWKNSFVAPHLIELECTNLNDKENKPNASKENDHC